MSAATDRRLVEIVSKVAGGGRVLDLPAGDGELLRKLSEAGVDAVGADLFPELSAFRPEAVVRADMNARLPFEDGTFAALVCQEGIEHLEDAAGFLRECRRVLVDGGTLLLTLPNVMDLSSRLSYFLTGFKSFHGDLPNEDATLWGYEGGRVYHGHAFTLPFFQLRYLLRIEQFDAIELECLKPSGTSRALYWAMRPAMGPLVRRQLRRRSERDRREGKPAASEPTRRELERFALSRDLLCAKRVLVRATLREGSFRPELRDAPVAR